MLLSGVDRESSVRFLAPLRRDADSALSSSSTILMRGAVAIRYANSALSDILRNVAINNSGSHLLPSGVVFCSLLTATDGMLLAISSPAWTAISRRIKRVRSEQNSSYLATGTLSAKVNTITEFFQMAGPNAR